MKKVKKIIKRNKFLNTVAMKIYKILIRVYDKITSVECDVSVGDLMIKRSEMDWGPFIAVSRYLDIVRYCSDDKYFLYEALLSNKKLNGEDVNLETFRDEEFEILIKEIKDNGYDKHSLLSVDKNLVLFNGTHRIGVCLYYEIYEVRVNIFKRKYPLTIDDFFIREVESDVIEKISTTYNQVESQLVHAGHTLCLLIEGCGVGQKESVIQDMDILSRILNVTEKEDSLMIQFALNNPEYYYKKGTIFSRRAQQIFEILKIRYPDNNIKVSLNCLEGAGFYKEFLR